jgi:hypothetical protein
MGGDRFQAGGTGMSVLESKWPFDSLREQLVDKQPAGLSTFAYGPVFFQQKTSLARFLTTAYSPATGAGCASTQVVT